MSSTSEIIAIIGVGLPRVALDQLYGSPGTAAVAVLSK